MYRTTVVEDASIDTTPPPALTPAMADLPTATALPALASADVAPLARPVIPALTGIRGVAAAWVATHHMLPPLCASIGVHALDHSSVVENGFRAVDLFFILSGLILMLTHGHDFVVRDMAPVRRFLILRVVRVAPLHVLIMLAIVPFVLSQPDFVRWSRVYTSPEYAYRQHDFSWPGFVQSLFLLQALTVAKLGTWNGPSWTLSAEVLGYFLFPAMAWGLLGIRRVALPHLLAAALLGGECVVLALAHHAHNNPSGPMGTVRMLGGFGAGMALGRAVMMGGVSTRAAAIMTWGGAGLVALGLVVAVFSPVMVFGFTWLLAGLACRTGLLGRVLGCRPLLWLGAVSFPFYMVHFFALKVFEWYFDPRFEQMGVAVTLLAWALLLGVMFTLAIVLHRGVERPSHRLARRLAAGVRITPLAPPVLPA
ncbi:acyltransferase family protein [Komagataeibacter rhaeticus]|uniref:Acyltransferase n=1 Tax=Komagataeibacter rhaeticus TaxID=215221 RepID=A0A181CAG8_9PROT|nr:acyltransferase [Komagataeibacter rhaeticus]QIP35327.1 acyltransferase [Komagataeibacter rhaeticus]QOC47891.1 acyltransferase [Komagataeibacter rhaeticus]WPP22728.1 acyltransferase [Komagataeibacter rhaeticus]SAY48545.1 Acyltransferase family protein [Komagataeibacter rhaeticus]